MLVEIYKLISYQLLGGGGVLHCKHHNFLFAAEVVGKVDDLSENLALLGLIGSSYL